MLLDQKLKQDDERYVRGYLSVFEGLGVADSDSGLDLTLSEYKNGKTRFVFDLSHLRLAYTPPKHGNCIISVRFHTAIPKSISVMCYLEYQAMLYINNDREVYMRDYSKQY